MNLKSIYIVFLFFDMKKTIISPKFRKSRQFWDDVWDTLTYCEVSSTNVYPGASCVESLSPFRMMSLRSKRPFVQFILTSLSDPQVLWAVITSSLRQHFCLALVSTERNAEQLSTSRNINSWNKKINCSIILDHVWKVGLMPFVFSTFQPQRKYLPKKL